jgi:voltage-gated potassium channel
MQATVEPQIGDFPFTGECQAALEAFAEWRTRFLDLAADRPLETLVSVVAGSAWVFYLAEKDANEGIDTYDDAFYYISTCLSVGYANVYPVTQIGKFVAAVVMMIGPSLSSWVVEGRLVQRQAATAPPPLTFGPVVEKLDAILDEMRAQRAQAAT